MSVIFIAKPSYRSVLASRPVPEGDPDQAAILADRLHSAAIHLLRRVRRSDVMTGFRGAPLSALSVLMHGPRTIGELAAAEQVQPPTISRLIRQMERAGLVERTRDERDLRQVWIRSTETGQRVLARGRELRVKALSQAVATLDEDDQRVLRAGLAVIDKLLETL
jgi:DNA-binding MarR family transcriptional regulator